MSDVFISYRRGDTGWARSLYLELKDPFDVFFDTNRGKIDYGDNFDERISDALEECRVVLVVIGPEWVKPENLNRLSDEKDWVRREIEAALEARPRTRVVPILMGAAKLPPENEWPIALGPLVAQANDLVLSNENWDVMCDDLRKSAERWLRDALPSPTSRRGLPAYLACLCDRLDQQRSLVGLVTGGPAAGRAYACVVHGHVDESHDAFCRRIRQQHLLEEKDMFNAGAGGLATCALQWSRERAKVGQHQDELRQALKAGALQRASAKDADLDDYLRTLPQPLVAFMEVTWGDCEYCGPDLVARFIDGWRALIPTLPDSKAKPALLWINLTYDSDDQTVDGSDPRLASALLPRLAPVGYGDIRDWSMLPDVTRANFDFLDALRPLTDQPETRAVPGRLRMKRFVDAVRALAASAP